MIYPIREVKANESGSTSTFKGLNRTDKGQGGEWLDVSNLDTEHYPCLAPRIKHGTMATVGEDVTIAACAAVIHDDGEYHGFTGVVLAEDCINKDGDTEKNYCFYYRGERRTVGTSDTSVKSTRTALWRYNTSADAVTQGEIDTFNNKIAERVQWTVIFIGERYVINGYDATLKRGKYFVFEPEKEGKDKTNVIPSDEQASYSGLTFGYTKTSLLGFDEYTTINYIESSNHDFTKIFNEGDYLFISGVHIPDTSDSTTRCAELNVYPYNEDKSGNSVKYAVVRDVVKLDNKGSRIYYYSTTNTGKFVKNLNPYNYDKKSLGGITADIGTFVPPMAHICAFGSRVWGVRPDENSVYASVFDTPFKLMNTDSQLSTSMSWQAVLGTADEAVGVFPARSEMLVMKKNSITRISGTSASSFTISGIFSNCGCIDIRSCTEAAGTVYYLGYNGFYAYDGSQPQLISSKLNCKYKTAVGFTDGNKYYASAVRSDTGAHEFLVYDIRCGTWLKWDDTPETVGAFRIGENMYIACNNPLGRVMPLCKGTGSTAWSCESVEHYESANTFKAVNELWLRAFVGDTVTVETSVNGGGWKVHKTLEPKGRVYMYKIPVRLSPGDYWQYRLAGKGAAVIHNIERVYDSGGGRHYKD